MRPLLGGERPDLRVGRKGVLAGALCLCALTAVSVHYTVQRTELAGAPYGGYWGGYYDAGYYGAYNNPYAYDVARQDYWTAMNAYDAAGVWSYNDWVDQRRDWDAAGYGYGPYDTQEHADYWRSADQNGWGDQTRYNNYLADYNHEAGGEYPYGYPSIEDNYEWKGGGYPSIADNFEQRGGLYRRASDMKDSNHQGRGLREDDGKHTIATKAGVRTSNLEQKPVKKDIFAAQSPGRAKNADATKAGKKAGTHTKKTWKPLTYRQLGGVKLGNKKAPPAHKALRGMDEAKEAYARAAKTFLHAMPGATYRQWLDAIGKWDQFFVADRVLDTYQVQLDERKAVVLKSVLPSPAFPALRQVELLKCQLQ